MCLCNCNLEPGWGGLNCSERATGPFGFSRTLFRTCAAALLNVSALDEDIRSWTIEFTFFIRLSQIVTVGSDLEVHMVKLLKKDNKHPNNFNYKLLLRYHQLPGTFEGFMVDYHVEHRQRDEYVNGTLTTPGIPLIADRRYHVALTVDWIPRQNIGDPNRMTIISLYLNGRLVASGVSNRHISLKEQPLVIGHDQRSASLTGFYIDEFRVWSYAKSQKDIQDALAHPLSPVEIDDERLILYLNFDNDTYDDVTDKSLKQRSVTVNKMAVNPNQCVSNNILPLVENKIDNPVFSAEQATPTIGQWHAVQLGSGRTEELGPSVYGHSLTFMGKRDINAKLYLIGGATDFAFLQLNNDVYEFDMESETWSIVNITNPQYSSDLILHSATALDDTRILVVGGVNSNQIPAKILNIATKTWEIPDFKGSVDALDRQFIAHSVALHKKKLYIFGGYPTLLSMYNSALNDMVVIDTETWSVESIPASSLIAAGKRVPRQRGFAAFVGWNATHLALYGGIQDMNNPNPFGDFWLYDIETRTWTETTQFIRGQHIPKNWFSYTSIPDVEKSILLFSGLSGGLSIFSLIDPNTEATGQILNRSEALMFVDGGLDDEVYFTILRPSLENVPPVMHVGGAMTISNDGLFAYFHGGIAVDITLEDKSHIRAQVSPHVYYIPITGCPMGHTGQLVGLNTVCSICPEGTYQGQSRSSPTTCMKCEGALYSDMPGSARCLECIGEVIPAENGVGNIGCKQLSSNLTGAQIFGIVFSIAVVVVGSGIIVFILYRKLQQEKLKQPDIALDIDESKFDKVHWLSRDDLQFGEELGSGSFGSVYKGTYNGITVAIKVSKPGSKQGAEEFLAEAGIMMQLKPHPHVIQLIGVAIGGSSIYMVLEFVNGGSLEAALRKGRTFQDEELRELLVQICRGLQHLHSNNLVHRDLAARNILLHNQPDGSVLAKISDFGMSRKVDAELQAGQTVTNFGPIPWMSPEAIGNLEYSPASDIWSLGITIWEIVTGSNPANQMPLIELAMEIRDHGYHPRIPPFAPSWLTEILEGCWKFAPEERISLSRILSLLDDGRYAHLPMSVMEQANKNKTNKKKGASKVSKLNEEIEKLRQEVKTLKAQLDEANAIIAAYEKSGATLPTSTPTNRKSSGWAKGVRIDA